MECDACDTGLGSVLYQENKLIGFYSYKFTPTESSYTIVEKELLGILKSLEHFRNIVFSSHVNIFTDNANLLFRTPISTRVQRWKLKLEEFAYSLQHIQGSKNTGADLISRINTVQPYVAEFPLDLKELQQAQSQDEKIQRRINHKEYKKRDIEGKELIVDQHNRLVIPQTLTESFLMRTHSFLEHPGETIHYKTLQRYFYMENNKELIKDVLRNCEDCQKNKSFRTNYGDISGHLTSSQPFEYISSDIYGPINSFEFDTDQEHDHFYILTITDIYSKWSEVEPLYSTITEDILQVLEKKWIPKHGTPKRILTDNGPQYISTRFEDFCESNGIKHIKTTPFNPTSNSLSERLNQQLGNVVRMAKGSTFGDIKRRSHKRLNLCADRTTGFSPYEKLRKISIFDFERRDLTEEINKALLNKRHELERNTRNTNKKRINFDFQPGKYVFIRALHPLKTDCRWRGPYEIVSVDQKRNFVWIQEENRQSRVNIKQIRPDLSRKERDVVPK
eukprot:GAHX01000236.1.p1 GENE.GAHX01000236.1~~GAHX01000236.1.p1  ORF type:complete len:505 (+),score=69.11 GAHX01000236.1:395-1909(+)